MRLLRVIRQRARSLFRAAKVEAELENELRYHLEELTRENFARGMPLDEARLAARRMLGGLASIEEQCRDQRCVGWLTDIQKDIVYAWRMLRKSPGFTALAVVTLAVGVGASIAVYALAESLLLRSLPFPSPERLVSIDSVHVRHGESGVGQENFRDWQSSNTVFERMAYTEFSQLTLSGLGDPERITGRSVSEGFFNLLGVPPQLGRWFAPEEQKPGADRVVMLSHGFWTRKMGARPEAVGSSIYLNDRAYRITGVMPLSFRFNEGGIPDYWTPISYRSYGRQQHQYSAYARLKPRVTVRAAQAQMTEIARRLEVFPDNAGWGVRVMSLRNRLLEGFAPALQMFALAASIILLIGCANIASLLLARGIGRTKEIAVRIALGAGKRRVVRMLLTESLLLSCLGALAGVALAWSLVRVAVAAAPQWLQLSEMLSVSPTLVAFVVALVLTTGALTGLWPAVRGSRADLQHDLKEGGTAVVAGARSLQTFVIVEIALAVALVAFGGLLAKSFVHLLHTDLGYRADGLLTFRMPLPASRYGNDQARLRFWDTLLPRLQALPGVVSAAVSDSIPLGGTYSGTPVDIEGQTGRRDWADVMTRGASVSPDYFRTMGVPLRSGRIFNAADKAESEPVVIVNEAFLRKLMPERSPLGARVRMGKEKWRTIVGVIGDTRYTGPTRPVEPEAYVPYTQDAFLLFVILRTAGPEESVFASARHVIRDLDPNLPITQVRTMRQSIDLATSLEREVMLLVAGFAAVALAMSTLGLGGVMAYTVSRRKREIGLRMALGASGSDISRAVIRNAARLVFAGSSIGILGALVGARVLESLLYGVRPHDPAVVAMAPVVLGSIALLACIVPARRAAAVDPMAALRQE